MFNIFRTQEDIDVQAGDETNIEENTSDIEALQELGERNSAYINTNRLDIIDLRGQIVENNNNIAANTADITTNTAQIATKLTQTPTLNDVTRALDVPFQISTEFPALVFYTVEMDITFSLLSSQAAGVNLLCDANNPPTTIIGKRISFGNQTLGLSITTNLIQREPLIAFVPAGYYVLLQTNGAGNKVLLEQTELIFQ